MREFFIQHRVALLIAAASLLVVLGAAWWALPIRLYFYGRPIPVVARGHTWELEPSGRCRTWGSGVDYIHETECDRDGDGVFDCRVFDCGGGGVKPDCVQVRDDRGDWRPGPPALTECWETDHSGRVRARTAN